MSGLRYRVRADARPVNRSLADTALAGRPVAIRLLVTRLVCREAACGRVTFVQQTPDLTTPHSRYSAAAGGADRVRRRLAGRAGAQLARRLGMPAVRDTLLNLLRGTPIPQSGAVTVPGARMLT
jgi:hypothetical protein